MFGPFGSSESTERGRSLQVKRAGQPQTNVAALRDQASTIQAGNPRGRKQPQWPPDARACPLTFRGGLPVSEDLQRAPAARPHVPDGPGKGADR